MITKVKPLSKEEQAVYDTLDIESAIDLLQFYINGNTSSFESEITTQEQSKFGMEIIRRYTRKPALIACIQKAIDFYRSENYKNFLEQKEGTKK